MEEQFITKTICELKHKEVEDMKEELEKLRECISKKFSTLNALMYSVLTALILNLLMMVLKG